MANTRDLIGEQETLDGLINQTLTNLEEDGIDELPEGALTRNMGLTSVSFPNVSVVKVRAFSSCQNLISANLPSANKVAQYCFSENSKMTTIHMESAVAVEQYGFQRCLSLQGCELPGLNSNVGIANGAFSGCASMTWLKLPQNDMVMLQNVDAFNGTPIGLGIGAIYVPSSLVATYKANPIWKRLVIASIDDYPLTDFSTIKDSWSEILAAEQDGTYSTKYAIGDTKKAVINGKDVYMQIVAFDADTLTGGGTAKITWITKHIIDRKTIASPGSVSWSQCALRSWLHDTVYQNLESDLKTAIKTVEKTCYNSQNNTTETVSDTLWAPSLREVAYNGSNMTYEDSGVIYAGFFTNNQSRVKYQDDTYAADCWWLRTKYNYNTGFVAVHSTGDFTTIINNPQGVVFGFCT